MTPARSILALLLAIAYASPQEPAAPARAGMSVWDTGTALKGPLSALKKEGWEAIPPGETRPEFKGDAAFSNGRLMVLVRKDPPEVQVFTLAGDEAVSRARLVPLAAGGEAPSRLDRAALAEHARASVAVQATFRAASGAEVTTTFRLKKGDVAVEAQPGKGADRLRVDCPARFAVLPDFFADDILIDAATIPGAAAEVPSENFLILLAGAGDAFVMAVFENRDQDVRIALTGQGAERRLAASEIRFGASKKVWVAVLAEPRLWHAVEIKADDAKKVIPLEWTMPFVASWRCDMTRPNGLADSWDMLLQHKKGEEYVKPAWFGGPAEKVNDATRRRFTEVLGFFPYPVWSDPDRRGYLQPLEIETRTKFVSVLAYRGPAVIYPFNRVPETPPDRFTMVDIARNALGVGPCEYILNIEGQKQEYKGIATCNARDAILEIVQKGEQKKRREEILKYLDDTLAFVKHIRGRIAVYVDFGHAIRAYLAEQKKSHPDLAGPIDELDRTAREIDARFEERAERMKTPDYVAQLNDDFRKNVFDAEGPEALKQSKAYGDALTRVGGNQDKVVSECRWVARVLRQQAGLMMAREPKLAKIATEIRTRSQEVLKNPSRHERARQ